MCIRLGPCTDQGSLLAYHYIVQFSREFDIKLPDCLLQPCRSGLQLHYFLLELFDTAGMAHESVLKVPIEIRMSTDLGMKKLTQQSETTSCWLGDPVDYETVCIGGCHMGQALPSQLCCSHDSLVQVSR